MKVTTVSASVRFSKALGDGQHKTVEVGAEASLDSQESWEAALAQLYAYLGHELKALWGNGNHKAEIGAVVAAEALLESEPRKEPQRHTKGESVGTVPDQRGRFPTHRPCHGGPPLELAWLTPSLGFK